jgi:hypothetical protein
MRGGKGTHSDERAGDMSLKNVSELDVIGSIKTSLDNLSSPPVGPPFVPAEEREVGGEGGEGGRGQEREGGERGDLASTMEKRV